MGSVEPWVLLATMSPEGKVKKSGLLKIVHEKYTPPTSSRQKLAQEVRDFQRVIWEVAEDSKEIKPFISKAQETLNPLKVLQLFSRIPDQVRV